MTAVSAIFISGYLLHYGHAAYRTDVAPAPPPAAVAAPTAQPAVAATPVRTAPAEPVQTTPAPVVTKPVPAKPVPIAEETSKTVTPPPAPAPAPSQPEPAPAQGTPSIKWEQAEYDFGSVYQQEQPEHEFVFTNAGTAPLRIEQVITTCACAVGKTPDKPIAPGENGSITVTFLAGRMRGKTTKYIFVVSNDPAQKRSMLTIKAEVKLEADVVPSGLYFGSLKVGDTVERPIVIRPVEVKSFRIVEVKSESPLITVAPPEHAGPPEPDGSYRLMVKIGPADKAGQINSRLVVRTDLPHQKELLIPVYGRAVQPSVNRATTTQ